MRSKRTISRRTLKIVASANAGSVCHRVSSDTASSTSPCQLYNWPLGAVARTPAIISGKPANAATMRKTRRRVGRGSAPPKSAVPARAVRSASAIVHRNRNGLGLAAQLHGLHQRRAPRLVIIFDLAIEALKALGGDDFPRRLDRPHWTGAFAQMTGTAAFR